MPTGREKRAVTAAPGLAVHGPGTLAKSVLAGAVYFLIVFAAGFGLGTIRVAWVAPRLGATAAVLLEAPFMLAASWAACGWCVRRFRMPPAIPARMVMGTVAFTLLMAAELGLSLLLFGRPVGEWLADFRTPPGALGLLAQIAFGLIPLVRTARAGRRGG